MKKLFALLFVVSPLLLPAQLRYPETKKGATTDNYHGTSVEDP
jgi:hypothetical protein